MKIEVERRFLVDPIMTLPINNWNTFFYYNSHIVSTKEIEQTYLKPNKFNDIARIRSEFDISTKQVKHTFNSKQFISNGVSEETEYEIFAEMVPLYLKMRDVSKVSIKKTRISFNYNNFIFELDMFKTYGGIPNELKLYNPLLILEVELKNMNEKFELPPFISVLKEVTNDARYRNINLATKI